MALQSVTIGVAADGGLGRDDDGRALRAHLGCHRCAGLDDADDGHMRGLL